MGFSWIAAGLMADVIHGIGNFVAALLLFKPLYTAFEKVYRMFYQN